MEDNRFFSPAEDSGGRPLKFYEASLFQFINPKAWTVAIVASGFFPAEENFIIATMFLVITAAVVCFPSIPFGLFLETA